MTPTSYFNKNLIGSMSGVVGLGVAMPPTLLNESTL